MKKLAFLFGIVVIFGVVAGFAITQASADGNGDTVEGVNIEANVEVDTIFGFVELEFGTVTLDDDEETVLRRVEVSTPFHKAEGIVEKEDLFIRFEFDEVGDDEEVPVEAEARLETYLPGCGEITVDLEWEGSEWQMIEEKNFDDGDKVAEEKTIEFSVEDEDDVFDLVGEVKICDLFIKGDGDFPNENTHGIEVVFALTEFEEEAD